MPRTDLSEKATSQPASATTRLVTAYRALHEQVFLPIFATNFFDGRRYLRACVEAGCKVVEITLRRSDSPELIEWFRTEFPDRFLLVGSTLENDRIVERMRQIHPQLRTLSELSRLGVDGLVSMTGWSLETIDRLCESHLLAPTSMTMREAYLQLGAGAHFVKVLGPDLDLVRLLNGAGGFGSCPILITGGMSLERIPEALNAGAMCVGAGFEILLGNDLDSFSSEEIVGKLRECLEISQEARRKRRPEILPPAEPDTGRWLASLPHYHPF